MTRHLKSKRLLTAGAVVCASVAAASFSIATSSPRAAVMDTTPAASEMGVFNSAQQPSDTMPQDVANWANALQAGAVSSGVPASEQPGSVLTRQSHLLLAGQGNPQADLYVVPTSKSEVCYVLSLGPATCVSVFSGTNAVGWTVSDPDAVGSGSPLMVYGIAPDSVGEVDVVVDGSSHPATLKNNAFFYQLANGSELPSAITAINVSYSDGASTTISLHLADPPKVGSAAG